jgi:hypothetical protein
MNLRLEGSAGCGGLFGIGLTLLLEVIGAGRGLRGQLILWTIAAGVQAIGLIEWLVGAGRT